MNLRIQLQPVYSALAPAVPPTLAAKLPENWRLRWHQLATWEALRDPEVDVVINTAMTGDGKSLAAYLGMLVGQPGLTGVMGLYPTNELGRDQAKQVAGYIEHFGSRVAAEHLSGPKLQALAEAEEQRRKVVLERISFNTEILLTNPDIFHYLHRGAYLAPYENVDQLWRAIDMDRKLIIFDEFHTFSAQQIVSVINTMILIKNTSQQKKFLFLSATPESDLKKYLGKAEFRVREIKPGDTNKYFNLKSGEDLPDPSQWNLILRPVTLDMIAVNLEPRAGEQWILDHLDQILDYFLTHPQSKGAIILNSIASVKRLLPHIKSRFAEHGLTVSENTGLTGKTEKLGSLDADLVIGTSTIDVGVDFKINFLVFESADAGTFIQRLGRLGRHDGFTRDAQYFPFTHFTAYALIPNFVLERLFQQEHSPLKVDQRYSRSDFYQAIREAFPKANDFRGYYRQWGTVQSLDLWMKLGQPTIQSIYRESREKFYEICTKTFGVAPRKRYPFMKQWREEFESLGGRGFGPIYEEAISFRGSSPLQCALLDWTEPVPSDRGKTYDLPGILTNLEVEPISQKDFFRHLEEFRDPQSLSLPPSAFDQCLTFLQLRRYRPEPLPWKFFYSGSLREVSERDRVQVLTQIKVWQPDNPWIRTINKDLQQQPLVSFVVDKPVEALRLQLRLPMYFDIYRIADETCLHDPSPPYAIALGQSALLLATLTHRLKSKGGELWIA
ncbi:MAG: hypothetical protein OHK0012_11120 [Synechococcales cyanobacterium]